MANLKRAYQQLFARPTDERFSTFDDLYTHCSRLKDESQVHWKHPTDVFPVNSHGNLALKLPADQAYQFNDWSFGQVCAIAEVKKETVNRLRVETATQVLTETLPKGSRPFQVMTRGDKILPDLGQTDVPQSSLARLDRKIAFFVCAIVRKDT